MKRNVLYNLDCREGLKRLEDDLIDCFITSPPYWSLRDYQVAPSIWDSDPDCEHVFNKNDVKTTGQMDFTNSGLKNDGRPEENRLKTNENMSSKRNHNNNNTKEGFCVKCGAWQGCLGLEPDFNLYVKHLADIYDIVKQKLKKTGTCWINLGDTYAGGGRSGSKKYFEKGHKQFGKNDPEGRYQAPLKIKNYKSKCLCLIPQRFAIEMINRGWILRNTVIWHKGNCMPSCLNGNTRVFIKNRKGIIKHIYLKNLKKDKHLILTPNGWKKILNIWKKNKNSCEIKIGKIDKIICSDDHRFAITHDKRRKIIHYIESKNIRHNTSRDKFIYSDISQFLSEGKNKEIDIIDIKQIDWFADITNIKIKETPLELARKCNDPSLRKYIYENTWVYASDTHNELRRKRVLVQRLGGYDFYKVSAKGSPKFENRYYILDYDLGWLIGLYIAEGGFNQPRGYQGKITLHKNELNICKKFQNIFFEKFGVKTYKEKIIENYIEQPFRSACFYGLVKYFLVKGKCKTKELNINYLLNTPIKFRKGIIDGYVLGDGHIYKNSERITVTSASHQLIKNIQTLWASIGVLTSIDKNIRDDKRTHKNYTSWSLRTNSYLIFNERHLTYSQSKEYKNMNKKEEMYDIEVDGSIFLIENGIISHNSCKDRFTVDFEYVYFFVKNKKYWFDQDAVREPLQEESKRRAMRGNNINKYSSDNHLPNRVHANTMSQPRKYKGYRNMDQEIENGNTPLNPKGRNKRCVWHVNTKPNPEAHFATFNADLIRPMILSGCPEFVCKKCGKPREKITIIHNDGKIITENNKARNKKGTGVSPKTTLGASFSLEQKGYSDCGCNAGFESGIVCDPFVGTGTTLLEAFKQGRDYIGFEISEEYCKIANKYLDAETKFVRMDKFMYVDGD